MDSFKKWFRGNWVALVVTGICLIFFFLFKIHVLLADAIRTHPVWAALILGAACFAAAFLIRISGIGEEIRDAGLISANVILLLGVGFLLTGAAALISGEQMRAAAQRAAMLWALAWFMLGFLIGFLFGVPKVDGTRSSNLASPSRAFTQRPNTNLEQISDWLTKIIVGLGLVHLTKATAYLKEAATWLAEGITDTAPPTAAAVSFGGSLIIYFSIVGFLSGYLLTLLFLAGAFRRAGEKAYGGTFGENDTSARIRNFWRPDGGAPDPRNEPPLKAWIHRNLEAGATISDLLNRAELEKARLKVIADLDIP